MPYSLAPYSPVPRVFPLCAATLLPLPRLIDQHYYAIASKATLLKPKDMPVPADKFEAAFGLPWAQALKNGNVYNALDACTALGTTPAGLDKLWGPAKKVKFGGGFCEWRSCASTPPTLLPPHPRPHPRQTVLSWRPPTRSPSTCLTASLWRCAPSSLSQAS
jgi:hypothetical protein